MTQLADCSSCNLIGAANIPALTHKNLSFYTIRIFPPPPFPLRAPLMCARKIRMARETSEIAPLPAHWRRARCVNAPAPVRGLNDACKLFEGLVVLSPSNANSTFTCAGRHFLRSCKICVSISCLIFPRAVILTLKLVC